MKIFLDTNILLSAVSSKSKSHWIFQNIIDQNIELCVTTEILSEYAEILDEHANPQISSFVMDALMNLPSLHKIEIYYKWELIFHDQDDNKFVDCAISANADFLVTNDNHFNVVKSIPFPRVNILNEIEFLEKFNGINVKIQ